MFVVLEDWFLGWRLLLLLLLLLLDVVLENGGMLVGFMFVCKECILWIKVILISRMRKSFRMCKMVKGIYVVMKRGWVRYGEEVYYCS